VNLSYIVGPDNGPAIVFLPGIANSAESYQPVLEELETIARVFALSFRGHGSSDQPGPPYGVPEYTSDAVTLLESEVRSPAILCGHSLGGVVAARVAATRPELVREIILEDPPLFRIQGKAVASGRFAVQRDLMRQYRDGLSEETVYERLGTTSVFESGPTMLAAFGEHRLRLKVRELLQADPEVLSSALDGNMRFNTEETLKLIRCRVTLLSGEAALGSPLSDEDIRQAKSQVSSIFHIPVSGVGHFIRFDARESYLRVVRERVIANRAGQL
jgi:pimeloyl-ACP methyl ester carboxylesterase